MSSLIYPMFGMVLLTATVLTMLFRSRVRAVRDNSISAEYFSIYQGEVEPESTAKPARHFTNLFEAPTLSGRDCAGAVPCPWPPLHEYPASMRGLC